MQREALTERVVANLTLRERLILEDLANQYGATMSGVLRKLIRDAAHKYVWEGNAKQSDAKEVKDE